MTELAATRDAEQRIGHATALEALALFVDACSAKDGGWIGMHYVDAGRLMAAFEAGRKVLEKAK